MEPDTESSGGIAGAAMRLIATLMRITGSMSQFVDNRAAAMRATWKHELRRTASALIYSLVAAFFICSAAAWGAVALMMAFWETHRVLVASLLAAAFLLLAGGVLWLLHRDTR
ncbi:MAG: hypothetical protein U1F39_09640 [Steroidobacteraceae bacterium]